MAAAACAGAALTLAACGSSGSSGSSARGTITLYNGQHQQLTQAIVTAFEKQTGIRVKVRTDDSITLADQILQEGGNSPADVYLCENSPELMLLTQHKLLTELPASVTDKVPAADASPTGNWVGVALRISAIAYNPSKIGAPALPTGILDLAKPQWKGKVAIPPTDSDFVPLVGAVLARYGHQAALDWLQGLKRNAKTYQDEESAVAAVNRGAQAIGLVNQYYWYRMRQELGTSSTHSKLAYFTAGDPGNVENIGGAGVLASSKHQKEAQKFVAFLVSPRAQRILAAGDDFEYPAVRSVSPNKVLPPLATVPATSISVTALGDDLPAAKLMREAGLA